MAQEAIRRSITKCIRVWLPLENKTLQGRAGSSWLIWRSDKDAGRYIRMVLRSTRRSVENGEVSLCALVELFLAAFAFLYLYGAFGTTKLFLAGLFLAGPFLLFRSRDSVKYGADLFTRAINGFGVDQRVPWRQQRGSPKFWLSTLAALAASSGIFVLLLGYFSEGHFSTPTTTSQPILLLCVGAIVSWLAGGVLASSLTVAAAGFVRGPFGGKPAIVATAIASYLPAPLWAGVLFGNATSGLVAALPCAVPLAWICISNIAVDAALRAGETVDHPGAGPALKARKTADQTGATPAFEIRTSENWITVLASLPVMLGMFLASYVVRVIATLRFLKSGFLALPNNYRISLLVIDSFTPAELVPGHTGKGQVSSLMLWSRMNNKSSSRIQRVTASVEAILLVIPVFIYRFSIKATSIVYWAAVGLRFVSLQILNPHYDRVVQRTEIKEERGPLASAVFIILIVVLRQPSTQLDQFLLNPTIRSVLAFIAWNSLSPAAIAAYVSAGITISIWWFGGKIANIFDVKKRKREDLTWVQLVIRLLAGAFLVRDLLLGFVVITSFLFAIKSDLTFSPWLEAFVQWTIVPAKPGD